jgi:hypothetical protein
VRSDIKPILVIVAAAAVLALAFLGLRGTTTETEVLPPVDVPPPGEVGPTGAPIAVVISLRQEHETSLFGLWKRATHYLVGVQFYAPADCAARIAQGDPWPAPATACAVAVPVAGVVNGLGVAATGETIVGVEFETSEACYSALERGDLWPPATGACTEVSPAG